MPQELTTLSEGTIVQGQNDDRFVIERLLATGGFGAVYLVRNRRIHEKLYALKEISDPDGYERLHLTLEGEMLKRLDHPALPHVYQVFVHMQLNRVYMLMDYIEGPDLETLRMEQPGKCFSLKETLAFMRPVCEAVGYLHSQKPPVVHRGIKPANIIVSVRTGEAKLVNFGLAKEYVEEKTTNVFRYGTPGYAAAEQYVQGTIPRTDIYALGATIYTLLSGITPIDALTRNLEQNDEDPLLPLYLLNPAIPAPLSDVIEKAMSLRSKDRYATVEEFWQTICIATQLNLKTKEQWLLEGKEHYEAHNYSEALTAYEKVLEIDPDDDLVRETLGRIQIQLGRYDEALSTYEELLRRSPSASAYLFKGLVLQRAGRSVEALAAYQKAQEYGY